jgi:thiol-disulfide isomerase/thioredoxin
LKKGHYYWIFALVFAVSSIAQPVFAAAAVTEHNCATCTSETCPSPECQKVAAKTVAQTAAASTVPPLVPTPAVPTMAAPVPAAKGDIVIVNEKDPGKEIDLTTIPVDGKTTILDFYSEFCGPCIMVAPLLKIVAQSRSDLAVRKLLIDRKKEERDGKPGIDWASPLVKQHGIKSVPNFRIYGPDKKLIAEGEAATEKVMGIINEELVKESDSYKIANFASPGEAIELESVIVKGKTTIVDFFSEFCGPCKELAPMLGFLAKSKEDVIVRKLDLNRKDMQSGIDFESPLAIKYSIKSIPHLKIFDKDGKLKAEGDAAKAEVESMIEEIIKAGH